MLHEILLSLSGHPSPLLQSNTSDKPPISAYQDRLAPPEAALLASLARLSTLHQQLLLRTSSISSSHPSTICRAVSAAIVSTHLARFQSKILEVESNVLRKDASLVGSYGIVPLSGIVGEFDGWSRRIEWFWTIVQFVQPEKQTGDPSQFRQNCTGAAILNRLRAEAQTGYPDLEEAALDLLQAAETAWLRQLSTWLLYGRLPAFGAEDFFVQQHQDQEKAKKGALLDFGIAAELLPSIVTAPTASSILFIGRSLNHIRARAGPVRGSGAHSSTSPELALLPAHLRQLSALTSPISSSSLSSAISAIRLSLSRNTLQQFLPLPKILGALTLLQEYFLLSRGEFAVALITEAEARTKTRWQRTGQSREKAPSRLGSVVVKEGEVAAVLARTWAALSSFQAEEDEADASADLARDLIHLRLSQAPNSHAKDPTSSISVGDRSYDISAVIFHDLLLSTPIDLTIRITPPLDLLLNARDLEVYSSIHAYLLSVRRGHLRLTDLWKHSPLRRDHPSPIGPPLSNTRSGEALLQQKRARANHRARLMRGVWATSGAAVYLLAELGEYFQGEVVQSSWETFRAWIEGPSTPDTPPPPPPPKSKPADTTESSDEEDIWSSRSTTAPHDPASASNKAPHDPESIAHAHHLFLSALLSSLLLTDSAFTSTLRSFLLLSDRLITCVATLEQAWSTLDLETDEGVVDAFTDAKKEERMAVTALIDVTGKVKGEVGRVVARLRGIDGERRDGEAGRAVGGEGSEERFVPWSGGGVDRLLMKLDFGSLVEQQPVKKA